MCASPKGVFTEMVKVTLSDMGHGANREHEHNGVRCVILEEKDCDGVRRARLGCERAEGTVGSRCGQVDGDGSGKAATDCRGDEGRT